MFPPSGSSHPTLRREADAGTREPSPPVPQAIRHQHRERDFGIGYGNSSGYGSEEHYSRPWVPDRFRCV